MLQGYAWGLVTYLTFCHIFYDYICNFVVTIKQKTAYQLIMTPMFLLFVIAQFIALFFYFYNSANFPIPESWILQIAKNCPGLKTPNIE